jgi:hypothetical protein
MTAETPPATAGGPDGYCQYLENITPENLNDMSKHVSQDVHFRDPFNDVNGIDKMHAVFDDMFENIADIDFVIEDRLDKDNVTIIVWTLSGILFKKPWSVPGSSRLTFNEAGFLSEHIDFWDSGAGLYEHIPFIGWLPRALRHKLRIRP